MTIDDAINALEFAKTALSPNATLILSLPSHGLIVNVSALVVNREDDSVIVEIDSYK